MNEEMKNESMLIIKEEKYVSCNLQSNYLCPLKLAFPNTLWKVNNYHTYKNYIQASIFFFLPYNDIPLIINL